MLTNGDYTVEELARLCLVHAATVRRWIASGRVAAIRLPGGYYRIPAGEVQRLRDPLDDRSARKKPTSAGYG